MSEDADGMTMLRRCKWCIQVLLGNPIRATDDHGEAIWFCDAECKDLYDKQRVEDVLDYHGD